MKDIWVRPAKQTDLPLLDHWFTHTPDNLFDPDIARYPETTVLCATDGKPLVFMPIQVASILESLAVKPGASPAEVARSLELLIKSVALLSGGKGIHELYFLCHDPNVIKLAKRHGFVDMTSALDKCPHCGHEIPAPHTTTLRLKIDKIDESNA
jgi:hypothetical protein